MTGRAHGPKPKTRTSAVGSTGRTRTSERDVGTAKKARTVGTSETVQTSRNHERAEARRPITEAEVADLERLGAQVRELRHEAGMTQQQLADAAQLSRSQVRRIEAGTRRTRRSTLGRIAEAVADRIDDDADDLADRLESAAGAALAPESAYAERVAERRERRHRATHVEVGGYRFPVGKPIFVSGEEAEVLRRMLNGAEAAQARRSGIRWVRDA